MDYTNDEYAALVDALVVATISGIKNGIEAANQAHPNTFALAIDRGLTFQVIKTIREGDSDIKTVAEFHLAIYANNQSQGA